MFNHRGAETQRRAGQADGELRGRECAQDEESRRRCGLLSPSAASGGPAAHLARPRADRFDTGTRWKLSGPTGGDCAGRNSRRQPSSQPLRYSLCMNRSASEASSWLSGPPDPTPASGRQR